MKYDSIYRGLVTTTKDPKKRGRIKVLCPEVLGDEAESAWCEPCVPVAYDTGGDFCIPKVDEAVWVMFTNGDCNSPVYLGGWWSNKNTPLKEVYEDLDLRIISYADCIIMMKSGKVVIEVGQNKSVTIEKQKVTLNCDVEITGNLSVKGNISSSSNISASGSVSGTNID